MGRIERISRSYGIPLMDKAAGRKAVLKGFADRRVIISSRTVPALRSGSYSGTQIERSLQLAERLDRGVGAKDRFYLKLCEDAKAIRSGGDVRQFRTSNFNAALSEYTGISPQDIRFCFRAMRADLVLAEAIGEVETPLVLRRVLEGYFADFESRHPSKPLAAVCEEWDRCTAGSFYRSLYKNATQPHTLKTISPYEVDYLAEYYLTRINALSSPSPLDNLTIAKRIGRIPLRDVATQIQEMTGIPYDKESFRTHSNVLGTGMLMPASRY